MDIRKSTTISRRLKAQPRYRALADSLIRQIHAGEIAIGQTLWGEVELAERFGVSRHTVRDALRVLHDQGLIERRQGVGTTVRVPPATPAYVQTVNSPHELLQYPANAPLRVMTVTPVRASAAIAALLGCRVGSRWIKIEALRYLRNQKYAIGATDIYLLPEFELIVPMIGKRKRYVYELIKEKFGIEVERVFIDLTASLVPAERAAILHVAPASASLRVVRRYMAVNQRLFLAAVSEHPAERYRYSLQLARGWEAARPSMNTTSLPR